MAASDKAYEEMFQRLNKQFPSKIAVKVAYDNAIAHKIEAGADMFLMPSRYEPCGLNQIYSLKYGTVPIVRATGGLDDTIEPWDARTGKGTGFKFTEYNGEALLKTIKEALQAYRDQTSWQVLMRNGMNKDFSWNASAREYGKIYEKVRLMRGTPAAQEKLLVYMTHVETAASAVRRSEARPLPQRSAFIPPSAPVPDQSKQPVAPE